MYEQRTVNPLFRTSTQLVRRGGAPDARAPDRDQVPHGDDARVPEQGAARPLQVRGDPPPGDDERGTTPQPISPPPSSKIRSILFNCSIKQWNYSLKSP